MNDKRNDERDSDTIASEESASARKIRLLEGENALTPDKPPSLDEIKPKTLQEKWQNYWYHYKWHTFFTVFFAVVLFVSTFQLLSREKPDVYVIYAGPNYVNGTQNANVISAVKAVSEDYNGDGETGVLFTDITYMNAEQMEQVLAEAEAQGVDINLDANANASAYRRFNMEIFAGESVICFLDPGLYQLVYEAGGFLPLSEVWDGEIPESVSAAAADDCGLRLWDTDFGRYFGGSFGFEPDTMLAIRRVSTMSVFKGKDKIERIHNYHVDLFKNMAEFVIPAE